MHVLANLLADISYLLTVWPQDMVNVAGKLGFILSKYGKSANVDIDSSYFKALMFYDIDHI